MCRVLTCHPPEGGRLTVPLAQLAPGDLEELVLWLPESWLGARTLVRGATRRASRGASTAASRGERSLQRRGVIVAEVRGEIERSWSCFLSVTWFANLESLSNLVLLSKWLLSGGIVNLLRSEGSSTEPQIDKQTDIATY